MPHWMTICILNLITTLLLTIAAFYFFPLPPHSLGWLLLLTITLSLIAQTLPAASNGTLRFILVVAALLSLICFNLPFGQWLIVLLVGCVMLLFSAETYLAQLIKTSSIVLLIAATEVKPTSLPLWIGVIILGGLCGSLSIKPFWLAGYLRSDAEIYQRNGFKALAEYTQIFFAGLEASYYPQHIYRVERALHFKRMRCLQVIEAWQMIAERSHTVKACARLKETFTLLIDASQLRFRISDFTVFGLCADEIKQLGKTLVAGLTQLEHQNTLAANELQSIQQALAHWDAIYQQVVNVSAREPVVFVLFTETLKRLVLSLEQIA